MYTIYIAKYSYKKESKVNKKKKNVKLFVVYLKNNLKMTIDDDYFFNKN